LSVREPELQRCCRYVKTAIFKYKDNTYRPKEYEGKLSFGTDAWTSPNHKAFIGATVHFEQSGEPTSFVLDMVEVAKVCVVVTVLLFRRLSPVDSHTVV
jgi:hypothetical protein